MSRATDVVADAIADLGTRYHWAPVPSAVGEWARGRATLGNVGMRDDLPINCFSYPMLLAIRRGYLNTNAVIRILRDTMGARDARAYAFGASSAALWRDWPNGMCGLLGNSWRPRRGDLVFFKGVIGGILAHVAISTGVITPHGDSELITFGEGLMAMGQAAVNRSSVEALNHGYQSVHFLTPSWT